MSIEWGDIVAVVDIFPYWTRIWEQTSILFTFSSIQLSNMKKLTYNLKDFIWSVFLSISTKSENIRIHICEKENFREHRAIQDLRKSKLLPILIWKIATKDNILNLTLLSFYIFGNELSCCLVVVNSVSVRVGSLGDIEILARFWISRLSKTQSGNILLAVIYMSYRN